MTAPVPAAAPVAAPAAAPVAAPVAAPTAVPTVAPTAAPTVAPVAASPAASVAAPAASHSGAMPSIGSISSGVSGGIPDEHFNSPILFRLLGYEPRTSKYRDPDTGQLPVIECPIVDYIVIDPRTGQPTEVKGLAIMQKLIARDLVAAVKRGEEAVVGVAVFGKGQGTNPSKVLRPLDDENTGYKAADAMKFLEDLAVDTYHWWTRS